MRGIAAVLVVMAAALAAAPARAEAPDGGALLERARVAVDVRQGGAFELAARCVAPAGLACSYRLVWASAGEWREDLVIDDFASSRGAHAGAGWLARTRPDIPSLAVDLPPLVAVDRQLTLASGEAVHRVTRVRDDPPIISLEVRQPGGAPRVVYLDGDGRLLAAVDHVRRFDYAGQRPFESLAFPARLRIQRGETLDVELELTALRRLEQVPADALEAVAGAKRWTACEEPSPARVVRRTQPDYPAMARQRRSEGAVVLVATIAADGGVEEIRVLRSSGAPDLDRAGAEALARWRFEPARCGAAAVPFEYVATVSFHLP